MIKSTYLRYLSFLTKLDTLKSNSSSVRHTTANFMKPSQVSHNNTIKMNSYISVTQLICNGRINAPLDTLYILLLLLFHITKWQEIHKRDKDVLILMENKRMIEADMGDSCRLKEGWIGTGEGWKVKEGC